MEIFQKAVETEGRIIKFRVYKNHGETPRLQVSQSLPEGESEAITVCEEDVAPFIEGVLEAATTLGRAPRHNGNRRQTEDERYAEVRKSFPEAYRPWKPEEDERLRAEVSKGMKVREIAAIHNRKPGAIHSRIVKLLPEILGQ